VNGRTAVLGRGEQVSPDTVLALHRAVGNAAVARFFESHTRGFHGTAGPPGSRPVGVQRLTETKQNKAQIQQVKGRYLTAHPGDFVGWTQVLAAAKDLAALERAVPQLPGGDLPIVPTTTTQSDADLAAGVTTTDPYTSKKVGPFNGDDAPGSTVGAKDRVYFDARGTYCISRDRDEHAGEAWKLFKSTGTGWQRLATIGLDGSSMNRK
jgi:hypothetical protein